ncbi:hypothetical protein ACFV4K_00350 [Nocardia sp. NPDC059764]|uniref:hypothetical protein n=1 Tax=Nocardia sp. NPDC059764 TaxID=3346939 RepID=UPI003667EF74
MAFLSTDARAVSQGLHGRGGTGITSTSWHNMPDATVDFLSIDDIRGDIEIRWYVDTFEGVLADLTISEARTLRDKLNAAITEFEGPMISVTDNEVDDAATVIVDGTVLTLANTPFSFCGVCDGRIGLMDNGSYRWWTHEPFSINDHEPVPSPSSRCEVCGDRISWIDDAEVPHWGHTTEFATHAAVPRWTGAVA